MLRKSFLLAVAMVWILSQNLAAQSALEAPESIYAYTGSFLYTESLETSELSNAGLKNWGLGLRFGDPLGITAKKYMGNNRAWEFVLGRPAGWWYGRGYYSDRFERRSKYDDFDYDGYDGDFAISMQVHYLFHQDIPDAPGLQWYYGFGGQLRFRGYDYHYRDDNDRRYSDRVIDVGVGVDGVAGLEYTFQEVPLSVFLDLTLYLEIIDQPFFIIGQLGAGVRYNF